jgi:large subunit ribosomal protein L18
MIKGDATRPRLAVFRSNRHIYGQIIDDQKGTTLAAARGAAKLEGATLAGKALAEAALKLKIGPVVFDRRGYKFHGRVKALAQAAREGGLKF